MTSTTYPGVDARLRACAARRVAAMLTGPVLLAAGVTSAAQAHADNHRLNDSVISNVYTIQHNGGCINDVRKSAQLQLAAQWHTDDLMANRNLNGDIGSDESTVIDRARAAGFHGAVAETVAINPAVAISGIEILDQWYYDPHAMAIIQNCANSLIGVWSQNSLDRTVVVAVYGAPT